MTQKITKAQLLAVIKDTRNLPLPYNVNLDKAVKVLTNPKISVDATIWEIINPDDSPVYFYQLEARDNIATAVLHDLIADVDALVARPDNLLHPVQPGALWEAGYQNALARFLKVNARPVRLGADVFDWNDFSMNKKIRDEGAEIVAIFRVEEDEWHEFAGTDVQSDSFHGVRAQAVYSTGESRYVRWEGTFQEILGKLTTGM